jgi:hypothetical protein
MAHVADHLSIEELEQRYRACEDACSARHYQTIWLLAQGHTIAAVSALTSFVPRWIEELLARYNALGPRALGDLRRNNGTRPWVLKPELLKQLKVRLEQPPPDGGVWTSRKVADFMADQLGLEQHQPNPPQWHISSTWRGSSSRSGCQRQGCSTSEQGRNP